MLNFNPEQTLKLLARRRRTRPDVARKPWEWSTPTPTPSSVAVGTVEPQPSVASPGPDTNDGKTIDLTSPHVASYTFDDTPLRRNQRAIERHINDDHYVRGFTPGAFVLGGAGAPTHTLIIVGASHWSAIAMPDGATSLSAVTWRKPSEWRSGKLKVTFWYTSDVGSTNPFRIQLIVSAIKAGEVLAGTNLLTSAANYNGPAVANTVIKSADVYTTTSLGSDDQLFSLKVTRLGADANDTNVNAFHFLHATVEHIPAKQEAT